MLGVVATAWVNPHRNRAHCALMVVWCLLGTISWYKRLLSGVVMSTHESQVSWAVTMDDVSCGGGGAVFLLDDVWTICVTLLRSRFSESSSLWMHAYDVSDCQKVIVKVQCCWLTKSAFS